MSSLFQRIDTVFLNVKDLSRAIEWYTNVLGFTVRWRDDHAGYAALDIGETPLTLRRVSEGIEFSPNEVSYFNFYAADAVEAHEHLKAHGVEVGDIQSDETVTWLWFKDPDGNKLEVCSF